MLIEVVERGDRGYGATLRMFGIAGECLSLDRDWVPGGGGVRTSATAPGRVLRERLSAVHMRKFMRFADWVRTAADQKTCSIDRQAIGMFPKQG